MKTNKIYISLIFVSIISLISVTGILADAPAPQAGQGNAETRWYTGFGLPGSTEECFEVPSGWGSLKIRFWHTANQEWVDLETTFKTVDGVKKACATIPANGWIALQGQYTKGLIDPEISPCERDQNNCPILGCTDASATNYNPSADTDDGSCTYQGCTDPTAENYDPSANVDDGSCTYAKKIFDR